MSSTGSDPARSDDPTALIHTLQYSLVVYAACLAFYLAARPCGRLHQAVFTPRAPPGATGTAAFPGLLGPLRELRAACKATSNLAAGTEAAMVLRFITLNLKLLVAATILSAPLLPIYYSGPAAPPLANTTGWTALQALTLAHVPRANHRIVFAGVACLLYSIVYVLILSREYRRVAWYRRQWNAADGVEHATLLLTVESTDVISADEAASTLNALTAVVPAQGEAVEAQVVSVIPLTQLQSIMQRRKSDAGNARRLSAAGGRRAAVDAEAPSSACLSHGTPTSNIVIQDDANRDGDGCFGAGAHRLRVLSRTVLSDDLESECRFLVLLRQRRTAQLLCGSWPHALHGKPAHLRIELAPPPLEVYWANLFRSRWSRRLRSIAGTAITVLCYLFWTVPVTIVTGLATLQSLSKFEFFRPLVSFIHWLGPDWTALVETTLSSLVLATCRYITLNSGLFQLFVKLQGAKSLTQITSRAASRMLLFQLLLVLLLPLINKTLFNTLLGWFHEIDEIPRILARALPGYATFFMTYICNALLFVGLFDVLQPLSLVDHLVRRVWRALYSTCRSCAGYDDGSKPAAAPSSAGLPGGAGTSTEAAVDEEATEAGSVGAMPFRDGSRAECGATGDGVRSDGVAVGAHEYDSQYMLSLYTRMVLISSIYHVFMVVAPLTTLFAWLYFLPAYPLHAQILLHVLGRPEVDTAGAVWEQAVRYQTVGLLVSQLLLIGVAALKESPTATVLIVIAFGLTFVRTAQLQRHAKRSRSILLTQRAQLDLADGGEAAFPSLGAYESAATASLNTLFDELDNTLSHGIDLVANLADRGAVSALNMADRSAASATSLTTSLVQPLVTAAGNARDSVVRSGSPSFRPRESDRADDSAPASEERPSSRAAIRHALRTAR